MELLLAEEHMDAVEEFSTALHEGEAVNHAENPLETNPYLLYGILIGILVVCVAVLAIRKKKKKR